MTIDLKNNSNRQAVNLSSLGQLAQNPQCFCQDCQGRSAPLSHWEFMQTMPQDPLDMVNDLSKMGLFKADAFKVADSITGLELRKALFLKMADKGDH